MGSFAVCFVVVGTEGLAWDRDVCGTGDWLHLQECEWPHKGKCRITHKPASAEWAPLAVLLPMQMSLSEGSVGLAY